MKKKSNKKILGTNPTTYNGIKFKSTLECSCYKKLEMSGLSFSYESEKIILWKGIKLTSTKLFAPKRLGLGKYAKDLELQTRALMNMTYTPDFIVKHKDYVIYFDAKGKENDIYPLKRKMFLKHLEMRNDGNKYMFFEPHSVRQMMQAIDIIKEL